MKEFLDRWLVSDWRAKLYKELSTYMLLLGAAVPDLINLLLDNWDLLSSTAGFSQIDDGLKSGIRLTFIVLAFMSKFVKQYKVEHYEAAEDDNRP